MIAAYYKRLTSSDVEVRRAAAKEWTLWEMGTSKLMPDPSYINKVDINRSSWVAKYLKIFSTRLEILLCFLFSQADNLDFAAAFARIECHYFVNGIFLEEGFILKHCTEKLKNIPVDIVQGRYDVVCPAKSAWELHQAVPHSKLVIIPDAGHSMGEVGIAEELVKITNKYR